MSWNGSGQFVRNYSWVNDAANNIPITASRVDGDTNDITGNGFGNTLTRDGQGSATANLPMNGFKHTNCAPGVATTDYATFGQLAIYAPLASPIFTGVPQTTLPALGDNSSQIPNTAWVVRALSSYLPLSGGTLSGNLFSNGSITVAAGQSISSGGNVSVGGALIFSGIEYFGNGTISAPINVVGNITASGVFVAGSIAQPTIFVQSGTPTARNVGDLWFD